MISTSTSTNEPAMTRPTKPSFPDPDAAWRTVEARDAGADTPPGRQVPIRRG